MSGLTYLITGANRGIGRGLLETLILRPQTTVIAAVRNVTASSKTLNTVLVGDGSKIIIVKIDSLSATDPIDAAAELKSQHGITKLDVLISNAGHFGRIGPVLLSSAQDLRDHFEINTIGPLNLIQAFFPLLEPSPSPKFFVITSIVGTIGNMEDNPFPFFAYGISKTAANYLVRKLHFENQSLTCMAFHPGWVQTDMGNGSARIVGMTEAPMSIEDSIKGLVARFDGASRETSGTFTNVTGEAIPW
jgi:norsolorinic acid ketoreductase